MTGGVQISDAAPGVHVAQQQNVVFTNEELPGSRAEDLEQANRPRALPEPLEMAPGVFTERVQAGTRARGCELPSQVTSLATGFAAGGITQAIGLSQDSQAGITTSAALNTALDSAIAGAGTGLRTGATRLLAGAAEREAIPEAKNAAMATNATSKASRALPTPNA